MRVKTGTAGSCETLKVQTAVQTANGDPATAPMPVEPQMLPFTNKRLRREWKTMASMVWCYCRDNHGADHVLCGECQGLLDDATVRLDRCRFGPEKPTCAHCPVHCYRRDRRERMKQVMRYAGPRMIRQHPILSVRHWLDGFRSAPEC